MVDGVELAEARWWSREELQADVKAGRLILPPQGAEETVVFEAGAPGVWVSEATTQREGPALTIPSPPATELKDQIWRAIADAVAK